MKIYQLRIGTYIVQIDNHKQIDSCLKVRIGHYTELKDAGLIDHLTFKNIVESMFVEDYESR